MNNELEIIAQKYTETALNSADIESHYYHDALTKSCYQKISKGPLKLNLLDSNSVRSSRSYPKRLKILISIILIRLTIYL